MHGYYEFAGYEQMYELIRHTVRKGNIVVYPRWQTGIAVPCPGPFDIEPCMTSAVNGIRGALSYLRARPSDACSRSSARPSYFGFSFGGIITANLANRYRSLHLPRPRAIFLDDPHDGGLNGFDEPAVDDSLSGIPRTVKLQCHSGADGVIGEPNKANGSCNSIFPKLAHIPRRNKNLVLTHTDAHGDPAPVLQARRVRREEGHGRCIRLELLLEGLGRASELCPPRELLRLRAGRHPQASLERQVERRGAGHPARDPLTA